ncbi:unnamed protein product, partial [Meganyctiphanes norvegica]
MAKVHIVNVVVLDNPSPFKNPFQFEITFECVEDLQEELEKWGVLCINKTDHYKHDNPLCSYQGHNSSIKFQADPPDQTKIPVCDAVGVTVVLLTCGYKGQEFVRVGYYVNNSYTDPEMQESPPDTPVFDKLQRNILGSQPRVTKFKIDWDDAKDNENIPPAENTGDASTSQNSVDLKTSMLAEVNSNSACAMEVA